MIVSATCCPASCPWHLVPRRLLPCCVTRFPPRAAAPRAPCIHRSLYSCASASRAPCIHRSLFLFSSSPCAMHPSVALLILHSSPCAMHPSVALPVYLSFPCAMHPSVALLILQLPVRHASIGCSSFDDGAAVRLASHRPLSTFAYHARRRSNPHRGSSSPDPISAAAALRPWHMFCSAALRSATCFALLCPALCSAPLCHMLFVALTYHARQRSDLPHAPPCSPALPLVPCRSYLRTSPRALVAKARPLCLCASRRLTRSPRSSFQGESRVRRLVLVRHVLVGAAFP